MNEKILALRISLSGTKESGRQVDTLTRDLQNIGRQLDLLRKKGNQLKSLQDQLGKGSIAAGGSTSGSGGPGVNKRAQATDLNNTSSLRRQIAEAKEANASVDSLISRIGKLKAEQSEANREIRAAARAFEESKAAAGSYRAINAELVKARDNYRQLGKEERNSIAGADALNRIKTLDRELKDLDGKMGIYARNVGNYSSAFSKIGGAAFRVLGAVGIAISAEQIIDDAARISDAITGVEKVSGLAQKQVRSLADDLRLRDTRTSLEDQLGIAEVGGRLGLNAREGANTSEIEAAKAQLLEFTEAIDIANLALGDQFDNDAKKVASTLAGLRNVLSGFRPNGEADIGGDLLKIGNALNYLETKGNSTAPVIADFVNRIGGIAVPFDASTESIFALATTLDELEVTAERGGTAISNSLGNLAAAPEKFAQAVVNAGLSESTEAFTKLVNEDIITALATVSSAVQDTSNNNTDFSRSLQELGITGARAQEAFAKLGGNFERYKVLLEESSKALSETTSLTDEAEKRNKSLGASLDKLRNQLTNAFTSSEVQDALQAIIKGASKIIALLIELPRFIKDNRVELGFLIASIVTFGAVVAASNVETLKAALNFKVLARAKKIATAAQLLLNNAMRANPIGLVVAGIILLTGILVGFYRNSETVRNAVDGFIDSFRKVYDQSLLLKLALGPLGLVFKLLSDIFAEGPGVVFAYLDSIKTFASNVPARIEVVKLKFQELALVAREALSFGGASDRLNARLDDVRKEIEAQQSIIADNNEAFEERELIRKQAALKKRVEAEAAAAAKIKADQDKGDSEAAVKARNAAIAKVKAKVIEGKELTSAERAIFDALSDQEKDALKKRAKLRADAIAEAKRLREQQAKDRLAAAERILDLENELIRNRFDRQAAQSEATAARDIAGLVGDPEQIDRQTALIKAQLQKQLQTIEAERQEAQESALSNIRSFAKELRDAAVDNGTTAAKAEVDQAKRFFDIQAKAQALQLAQQQRANLIAFRDGEVSYAEFSQRKESLIKEDQAKAVELAEKRLIEESRLDANLTEELLAQADKRLEIRRAEREAERAARDKGLRNSFDTEDLTISELDSGLQQSEALKREQDLADLAEFEQAKLELAADFAARNLDRLQNAKNTEDSIISKSTAEQIRLEEEKKEAILSATNAIGAAVSNFLAGQTKTFKDFQKQILLIALDALKKFILLSIAQATAKEIGSKGFIGLGTAAVLTGLIQAAFSGVESAVSSFESGGELPASETRWNGGSVPVNSGMITGRLHRSGGVRRGMVEVEGGEYKVRNGNEEYIVNKSSTRIFRPVLDQLARNPHLFSAGRRRQVSDINSYAGFGRSFETGGVLSRSQPLPAPLNADGLVPFKSAAASVDIAEVRELAAAAVLSADRSAELAEAVNSRVDRLQVVIDPGKAVKAGSDQLEVERMRRL